MLRDAWVSESSRFPARAGLAPIQSTQPSFNVVRPRRVTIGHRVSNYSNLAFISVDFAKSNSEMIQLKTLLQCIDNSGAAIVECVQVLRMKRAARVGDRIIVVVKKQRNFGGDGPGGSVSVSAANKVRRGDVRHAVVVRTRNKHQRPDGSSVGFDDNACVLVGKNGEPIGSRLSSIVGAELRDKKWSKILSLAPMHL